LATEGIALSTQDFLTGNISKSIASTPSDAMTHFQLVCLKLMSISSTGWINDGV